MSKPIITLTAGHSDTAPGVTRGSIREEDVCQAVRDDVAAILRAQGFEVRTDGGSGVNQPLSEALKLISGAALAVELHLNGSSNPQAHGVEVVALPKHKKSAQFLAQIVCSASNCEILTRGSHGWVDQSVSPHGKLAFVQAGGMILELFFLSNEQNYKSFVENRAGIVEDLAWALAELAAKAEA